MSCPDKEILRSYVKAEMAEEEKYSLEDHFKSCEVCYRKVLSLEDKYINLNELIDDED